jgi:hypothetical protein
MKEKHKCPVCDEWYSDRQSWLGHMRYMRKICDRAHFDYQSDARCYKCPICAFDGKRKSDVGGHIFHVAKSDPAHKHFYEKQVEYVIDLFEQGKTPSQIIKVEDIYFSKVWVSNLLKETKGNTNCPICNKIFRDKTGLVSHLAKQIDAKHQEHLKEIGNKHYQRYSSKERQCLVPGCSHKSVWLDRHMRMKVDQGDKGHVEYRDKYYKHICPICNKAFQSQSALMQHIRRLTDTDEPHRVFIEDQKQKMINYFEGGLCIDEIMKQSDIIYSFADGIYPIIHANFSEDEIYQRGRDKCGEKNSALIAADPAAFFGRMEQARTQGSRAQKLCAQLLQEKLPECYIKQLDQDIFPGKEIDITIPELKVAIEWQGPPHHRPIFGEKSLQNMRKSDKAKRTYFKRIGWQLIEIIDNSNSGFNEKFVQEQVDKIAEKVLVKQII